MKYFESGVAELVDYEQLRVFDEEAINAIFEHSNDKLQRMMAFEIARLKGFMLARSPEQPEGNDLA